MRRTLCGALAAAALLSSCSSPRSFLKDLYSRGSEAEELQVNPDSRKSFRVRKSEAAGVVDLQKLVAQENFEEAWVYVPEDKEWWEVGRFSWEDAVGVYTIINDGLIEILAGASPEVVHYHFHPERVTRKLSGLSPTAVLSAVTLTEWALPSDVDLRTALAQSCYITEQFPGKKIRFKVASTAGVVEYTPLLEKLDALCTVDFKERYRQIMAAVQQTVNEVNIGGISQQLSRSLSEKIPALLHEGDYFHLYFTPYQ